MAPLFVGQGGADPLVDPGMQRRYLAGRRAAGQELEYHEYAGLDHVGVVGAESPLIAELFSWTTARFAEERFTPNCDTIRAD